jgi:hypothetical protein
MNAPRRWLDDGGGATPGERDLLRSGLGMDPPPDAQAKVWAAILAGLPAGAGGAGSAAGGKGAAAAKAAVAAKSAGAGVSGGTMAVAAGAGVLKSALIGASFGVLVLATYSVVAPSAPEPLPAAPAVAPLRDPVPAPPRGPETHARVAPPEPTVAASVEAPPEPRANEPRAPADRATMLAEESRLVGEAQDALRGGDAAGALVLLDRIAARFPGGGLGQEREALSVEALYRSGRRPEASARAAAFLKAYPSSTLAARVETFSH